MSHILTIKRSFVVNNTEHFHYASMIDSNTANYTMLYTKRKLPVPCPDCDGHGYTIDDRFYFPTRSLLCETCLGVGKLEVN